MPRARKQTRPNAEHDNQRVAEKRSRDTAASKAIPIPAVDADSANAFDTELAAAERFVTRHASALRKLGE
jgi:hypothetical protein